MVSTMSPKGLVYLLLGLLHLNLRTIVAQAPDYSCSASKGCKIGCCGPL
jgi:hypothetical protein